MPTINFLDLVNGVMHRKSAAVVDGYTYTTTATSKTLVDRERVTVTAAGQTITLPASPTDGTEVWISVGDFDDTIIARNGYTIAGVADDRIINKANTTVGLYYHGGTWRFF